MTSAHDIIIEDNLIRMFRVGGGAVWFCWHEAKTTLLVSCCSKWSLNTGWFHSTVEEHPVSSHSIFLIFALNMNNLHCNLLNVPVAVSFHKYMKMCPHVASFKWFICLFAVDQLHSWLAGPVGGTEKEHPQLL